MITENLKLAQATETRVIRSTIKTILLATDGTNITSPAFENAIQLLKETKGRLVLTYFADPDDVALYDGFPCQSDEEWQAYGQRVLERLARQAEEEGISQVETILEHYQGEEGLAGLAARVNADLIVLDSHLFQHA